jgi:hypothetical protein
MQFLPISRCSKWCERTKAKEVNHGVVTCFDLALLYMLSFSSGNVFESA